MGKILDLHGNTISGDADEQPVEDKKEEQSNEEQQPPSKEQQMLMGFGKSVEAVVEATLNRAELQNVKLTQELYMQILNTSNQLCLIHLFKFLSKDIGVDSIDMIFTEDDMENLKSVITFERNVEPTQEELDNLNNKK